MTPGGVAAQLLHCPTCGDPYELPLLAEYDAPPMFEATCLGDMARSFRPAYVGRPYVTCPQGHRWTIAVVFRVDDAWDEILLGQYIGGGA